MVLVQNPTLLIYVVGCDPVLEIFAHLCYLNSILPRQLNIECHKTSSTTLFKTVESCNFCMVGDFFVFYFHIKSFVSFCFEFTLYFQESLKLFADNSSENSFNV